MKHIDRHPLHRLLFAAMCAWCAWCASGVLAQPSDDRSLSDLSLGSTGATEPSQDPSAWLSELELGFPGIEERLAALRPGEAAHAFLLAEDIASIARDPEALELARTLYLHAYAWAGIPSDQVTFPRDQLRAASLLGLVDMESVASTRRWLLSIARTLDASLQVRDWTLPRQRTRIASERYDAARVLGMVRAGRGDTAARLLDLPRVRDVLEQEGSIVYGISGSGNLLQTLDREADLWPCNRCRNARIVRLDESQRVVICPACNGNPGPMLTLSERVGWLSLESRLLERSQKSWAAQLASDLGEPLREPDPDNLLQSMGYDPDKTQWNGNAFVVPQEDIDSSN